MKKIIKTAFFLYRTLTLPRSSCRFYPTCSRYSEEAIEKYGLLKGSYFAFKRILSCHPFSNRPIYDPA